MPCIAAFFANAGANAVGTLMVDYVVKPVERRIRYLFRFNKIVEELRDQEGKLTREQTRVNEDVSEARRHTETHVIEQYVLDWLTEAKNALDGVQILECRTKENKKCFRWCPNWSWRYRLSKELEKKTENVKKLVESSKFERIGHRADLTGFINNAKGMVATKSSDKAFNEIMEALRDDAVNMIGVWGMGGLGKTTLVTQVGNKAKELQLFSKHIIVPVSQKPDTEKMQQTIADFLDLKFEKKIKEVKAAELALQLKDEKKKKEEKVLIILDDMWDELELETIGIPDHENSKRCKIILTTRERSVCELMECQVTVSLGGFSEDEAWTLFRMKANLDINVAPGIVEVAKEVAKECGRLPIAIVPLARALRNKDLNGWELARRKLKSSRLMDIESVPKEADKNAYKCLEMSYNHLGRKATKRCFLLCALFPEDSSINVESLVRYAWALRLYQEEDSIHKVRSEVLEAINILVDSCLLLEEADEDEDEEEEIEIEAIKERHIKLHDVVGDVATWIASKEDNGLVIKPGVGPENERSIQKLEILLDHYHCKTSAEYFAGMGELKVLSIKAAPGESSFSLNALKSLTNLRALELEGFMHLEGIADLACLTKLDILSLKYSECQESIDILGDHLKNLRVFDLRESDFNMSVSNLIRTFDQLEELYLCPKHSTAAILPVINLLPRLDSLSLEDVRSLDFPEGFMFPGRLQRYEIGINMERDKEIISSRSLSISNTSPLNVIEELLPSVEFLDLRDIKEKGLTCLIEAVQMKNAEKNGTVQMKNAEKNVDLLLSKLKFFRLQDFPYLEYIWKMPTQHVGLGSLEVLAMSGCYKLKSLFSLSMAQSLVRLQSLAIHRCDELAQIVEDELNPEKYLCFPELRYLAIDDCSSLVYMFPNCMASQGFPKLQNIFMRELIQLDHICGPAKQNKENSNLLFPSLTDFTISHCSNFTDVVHFAKPTRVVLEGIQLSKLKEASFMNIKDLSLLYIKDHNLSIPEVYQKGLNELTVLQVCYSNSLEYLVDTENKNVLPNDTFSNLEHLKLTELPELGAILKGPAHHFNLQSLKVVTIRKCNKLKTLFGDQLENDGETKSNNPLCLPKLTSLSIFECRRLEYVLPITLASAGGLPQLESVYIDGCDELKTVFADQLENDGGGTESNNPLCLPKLTSLVISYCGRLEYVLPITLAQAVCLPQLESVNVRYCTELKHVFGGGKEDDGVEPNCIHLPRLKHLTLGGVPNLCGFGPENYFAKAPSLESLFANRSYGQAIERLNSSKTYVYLEEVPLFAFKEFLSDAKFLELHRGEGLECLADNTGEYVPPKGFLQNLETLTVRSCKDVVSLYSVQQNLKTLRVEDCESLEEVFGMDGYLYNQAPLMSKLEYLELKHLPKLRWILKGPAQYVSLQSLKVVKIDSCDGLESLLSSSLIQRLGSLKELYIHGCGKLETVFTELESGDETESNTLCFPTLETLQIIKCPTLKYVWPLDSKIILPNLKILQVSNCPLLSNFTIQEDKQQQSKDFEELVESCNS